MSPKNTYFQNFVFVNKLNHMSLKLEKWLFHLSDSMLSERRGKQQVSKQYPSFALVQGSPAQGSSNLNATRA
jgi:hypothetical protein